MIDNPQDGLDRDAEHAADQLAREIDLARSLPSQRAEEIIRAYADAYRELDEAAREFARRSSATKKRLQTLCEASLREVSRSMDKETRRILASEAWWTIPDAPPKAILNGLGFNVPTGTPGDAIAVMQTECPCHRCGKLRVIQTPRARLWHGGRDGYCINPDCRDFVGSMEYRGVVARSEEGTIRWIDDGGCQ